MAKTWREKVAEIKEQEEFSLLGTAVEMLCEEASSAALEEAAKACDAEAALCHADSISDEERSSYWKTREYQAQQDAVTIRELITNSRGE